MIWHYVKTAQILALGFIQDFFIGGGGGGRKGDARAHIKN